MPDGGQPSAAVTVTRPVCLSCGAQANPDSVFCTECGHRLTLRPAPVAEGAPVPAAVATAPLAIEPVPVTPSSTAFCTNCGAMLEAGISFCTKCGQPTDSSTAAIVSEPTITDASVVPPSEDKRPSSAEQSIVAPPANEGPSKTSVAAESADIAPAPLPIETTRTAAAEPSINHDPVKPAPQVAAPIYATPSNYPPAQLPGGAFRVIVLILLLVIAIGGLGGWYFMGVETVIVCSPPDVTVFLDEKELPPASYGRYVIPHLSRQPHLLRVQRAGFADTVERLDFPLTSLHEWVNVKLVPRRQTRPSSSPR
jgi:uncharacterized OB-fold protein